MYNAPAALVLVIAIPTLLSALVIVIVNSLWYSPLLFGKSFIRHSSVRPGDMPTALQRRNTVIGIITAFLEACLLGLVAMHTENDWHALLKSVGFIWLFIMLQQLKGFTFRREPFALFLLTTFRTLFSLMAGAMVFYGWSVW
jgi:hypothetical protein